MEFIINNIVKIHPMALVKFEELKDAAARKRISKLTEGFEDKTRYFIDTLAFGIARIAASRYPNPVIVRMSDFKTNEYARLIGGKQFEPRKRSRCSMAWREPLLQRGLSRGLRAGMPGGPQGARGNRAAQRRVDDPVLQDHRRSGPNAAGDGREWSRRGENGLQIYVMCEIPSNVILAEKFAERFDGFSIGSNDLTQLTLGVDRDSERSCDLVQRTGRRRYNARSPAL